MTDPLTWLVTRLRRRAAERRARTEWLILGALGDGELSGYPLTKRAGIGVARLYIALDRMERSGQIESRWGKAREEGGPRPRLYRRAGVEPGR